MDDLGVTCQEVTVSMNQWVTDPLRYSLWLTIILSNGVHLLYIFHSKTPFPKPEWQALIDGYGDKQVVGLYGISVCETDNTYYLITYEDPSEEIYGRVSIEIPRSLLAPVLAKILGLELPVNLENNIKG